MSDLVDFLRARLDEDERVARETPEESRTWTHRSFVDYSAPDLPVDDHTLWFGDRIIGEVGFGDGEILPDEAEHIARHDPDRVLRKVAAKRLILDAAEAAFDYAEDDPHSEAGAADASTYRWVLQALALPYDQHPDYDESWRP